MEHDTKILAALRSGEEAALVTFLQTNEQSLLAFIRSRIGTQLQKKIEPEDVLEEAAPAALRRVQYIEQPTHRDLRANPENRMHAAAKIKPVVIDESLVDFESLLLAREQGYSGVALKACKGHSEALLMGAAAQKHNLFLCVQDLTCVGASFLHSASLAARVPSVAAIRG